MKIVNLEQLDKIGIYAIKNTSNGKVYIGSTAKSFKVRFNQHISKLRCNKHHCIHLQNAFNKYGEEIFDFEILEVVTTSEGIRDLEKYYIDKFDAVNKGYNENPDPNYSPMLNGTSQEKVSKGLKEWWKCQKETLSAEEYKALCMSHRGTSDPWNKGKKMSEDQTKNMRKPKVNGVSEKMLEHNKLTSKQQRDMAPYILVYDSEHKWLNTFWCTADLVEYSKSEFNNLPIKVRKGGSLFLDASKISNACKDQKCYKGLYFKRVPKDRKLPCANGVNSWKAECEPIMIQAVDTSTEGAETSGEVQSS